MKGISLTPRFVEAHQKRHGFKTGQVVVEDAPRIPKPRMNKCETEFSLMLEAQKRRGEILEWRYEGISLAWGCDPVTGKPMRYTGDFWVYRNPHVEDAEVLHLQLPVTIVECKGPHIYSRDLVRFRGCRSDWPMFRFELHQKTKSGWSKIL